MDAAQWHDYLRTFIQMRLPIPSATLSEANSVVSLSAAGKRSVSQTSLDSRRSHSSVTSWFRTLLPTARSSHSPSSTSPDTSTELQVKPLLDADDISRPDIVNKFLKWSINRLIASYRKQPSEKPLSSREYLLAFQNKTTISPEEKVALEEWLTALRPLSPLPPLTSPLEGANWATLMGLFLLDQMEIEFGDFDLLEFMRKACQDYMEGAIGRSSADLEYRVKTRKDLWMEIVAYPGIVGSSYNPDRYVRFLESLQKRLSAAEFSVVTTLDGGSTTPEILVQEKAGSQLGEAVKRIKERKTTTNDPPV